MTEGQRTFTPAELKEYDGRNGRPAYVGYRDRVIDVSGSKLWRNGQHMKLHAAGLDLTGELSKAPHDASVLDRYPQVGILVAREEAPSGAVARSRLRAAVERFVDRYPFFRRHPHPMVVHFPIVFMIAAPVFLFAYLASGVKGFEVTSVNCLAGGLLFCLIVIPAGLFTWWLNYMAVPTPGVIVKIVLSSAMFVIGLIAFVWRLRNPEVVVDVSGLKVLYVVLVSSLFPLVSIVAWYGAVMTFPLHASEPRVREGTPAVLRRRKLS